MSFWPRAIPATRQNRFTRRRPFKSLRAVEKRQREFAKGRECARKGLAALGVRNFTLLNGDDRAPIWPEGIVGSITHTRCYCGVVVARRDRVRALGIDAEPDDPLQERLWSHVCTEEEAAWLVRQPESTRGRIGKLIFSAKECFYKCQYTITRTFLGFRDVQCTVEGDQFTITLLREDVQGLERGACFVGSYRIDGGLVLTGMELSVQDADSTNMARE